jgi:hypothetical protein
MTKSRTAGLALIAVAAAWPAAAPAQPEGATAEQIIADYRDELRRTILPDCRRVAEDGEILVCGRSIEARRQTLPLGSQPEPGARHRLIAGEVPSGMGALNASGACCGGGGGINVIAMVRALGTGVDRILHPD